MCLTIFNGKLTLKQKLIYMQFLKTTSILATIVFFSSCGGGGEEVITGNDSVNVTNASNKFKKIPDATKADPSWKSDNVFIFHTIGEPDDMHPTNGNSGSRTEINMYTQVFLLNTNFRTLEAFPQLAKAMPEVSADQLSYTYEIKDFYKWDDGTPITFEDVMFTFKANKCPLTNNPHAKPYLENIQEITQDPTNKNKFTIRMDHKYVQNIWFVTDYPIMQRSVFDPSNVLAKYTFKQFNDPTFKADANNDLKEWGKAFNDSKNGHDPKYLVGAGPYKFDKWEDGQSITLAKKANHWTATQPADLYTSAGPDKIVFKINKDANSTKLDFKNQVFDGSAYMDVKSLLELRKDPGFTTHYNGEFMDTYNYSYCAMNMRPDGIKHKKLFVDKNVRRAMAMLMPIDQINQIINEGMNKRIVGPVSPNKAEYNKNLKLIPLDVEGAKKMLADAGWKDTDGDNILDKMIDGQKVKFEFELNYMNTSSAWKDMAQVFSESLKKAGVNGIITPREFSTHYDLAKNHDYDMMLAAWQGASVPEDFTQIWHTESWASKGSNYPGFGNTETDALIDSIKYQVIDSLRVPLVMKLQEKIYDEQPYIFVYAQTRRIAIHKRWTGQEMYVERPGLLMNNFKLMSGISKPAAQ